MPVPEVVAWEGRLCYWVQNWWRFERWTAVKRSENGGKLTSRLAAPASIRWMVWRKEETSLQQHRRSHDGVECPVDQTERKNAQQDIGIEACLL